MYYWESPGCPEVKNLPYNVVDTGLIPFWRTKIPHAAEQPKSLSTATAPNEPKMLRNATKTRHSQINKYLFKSRNQKKTKERLKNKKVKNQTKLIVS